MSFFNYYFYRMHWWNTKIVLDFSPVFSAILGISVIQGLNIVFILEFISLLSKWPFAELILNNYLIVLGIIPLAFNLVYYLKNKRHAVIINKCKNIPAKKRKVMDYICVAYTALSLILVVFTMINARANVS